MILNVPNRRQFASGSYFVLLCLASALLQAAPSLAAEIAVTALGDGILDDNRCTLREAIASANADMALHGCTTGSGPDTISLQALSSDYFITVAGTNEDLNQTGDFDIYDDLTIRSTSSSLVTIDGNELDRIFEVFDGANLTLQGLSLRDGDVIGFGGCILVLETESVLSVEGTLLNSCTSTVFGGSIFSAGPTMLVDSFINSGESAQGAGIYMSESTLLTVYRSELLNNYALSDGGAIHASNVLLEGSSLYFNLAGRHGGGLFATGSSASDVSRVVNSTISQNSSESSGGGIYVDTFGRLELYSSTVAFNEADGDGDENGDGGGFFVEMGELRTRNSVFGPNSDGSGPGGQAPDCSGDVTSEGHNLFATVGFGCSITGMTASDQAGGVPSPLDPELNSCLEVLGEVGTSVHSPSPTSPLLDAGAPAGCQGPDGGLLEVDQANQVRVWDGPDADLVATCDIGSLELGAPDGSFIFGDGFETGNTSRWASATGLAFAERIARPRFETLALWDRTRRLVQRLGGCEEIGGRTSVR